MDSIPYFIHGLRKWSKHTFIDLLYPEISVSLQKDGFTKPLRRFGFIVDIKPGGIIASFDRDVTSKVDFGKKVFSPWTERNWREYGEDMYALMDNTRLGFHNEIWICTDHAQIIGGYIVGESDNGFEKAISSAGYPVRRILC